MQRIKFYVDCIGILTLVIFTNASLVYAGDEADALLVSLRNIYQDDDTITTATSSDEFGRVLNKKKEVIGYFITTEDYVKDIKGQSGPIHMLICFDTDKKVIGVEILESNETNRYIRHIKKKNFLNSWNGYHIDEAVHLHVDTITGATKTTEAIIKTVKKRLQILGNDK